MSLSVAGQTTVFKQWQVEQTYDDRPAETLSFKIAAAKEEDVTAISGTASMAYFQKKFLPFTQRDPNQMHLFVESTQKNVLRRIKTPDAYTVLMCTLTEQGREKVIGTVYYQPKNTDFLDDQCKELAEMGLFAVHPDYAGQRKNYHIGEKMIEVVLDLAQKDRMRGIYIYAIGENTPTDGYSNALLEYYDGKGFKFVKNKQSGPCAWHSSADKTVKLVIMLNDLSKTMKTMIEDADDPKDRKVITIPENYKGKKMTVLSSEGQLTGFSWLLDRISSALNTIWAALCCGHREAVRQG